MKTKLLTYLLISMSLVACSSLTSSTTTFSRSSLSIIAPTGAPALAFYQYGNLSSFETNSDPSNITAMMTSGKKDVIVLPTNVGVKSILSAQAPYKLAASITFGNFFIASLGNDDNNIMDSNDNIVLFQKNNVPDKLFHFIYGDEFDNNIYYVNAVSDASRVLSSGTFTDENSGNTLNANYVLMAEPALFSVMNNKDNVSIYSSLQEEYRKITHNEIFQASIFVKSSLANNIVDSFLDSLSKDINDVIANPSLLNEAMNEYEAPQNLYGVSPNIATSVLRNDNGMGLGFKKAKENKEAIDHFLALFNIGETNEALYY